MKALTLAQLLVEAMQNMPVVAVQSGVPHWQSVATVLVVIALVMMQIVGGRFVQALVEETQ